MLKGFFIPYTTLLFLFILLSYIFCALANSFMIDGDLLSALNKDFWLTPMKELFLILSGISSLLYFVIGFLCWMES